jgi:hypothetical protein
MWPSIPTRPSRPIDRRRQRVLETTISTRSRAQSCRGRCRFTFAGARD